MCGTARRKHETFNRGLVSRQHGDALRTFIEIGKPIGQGRADPTRGLDGIGEFRGMRGRQYNHRHRRIALLLFRNRNADRGVRIDQIAGLALDSADRRRNLVLAGATALPAATIVSVGSRTSDRVKASFGIRRR